MSNESVTIAPGDTLGDNGIHIYVCIDCKQIIPIAGPTDIPYKYDTLLHRVEERHGGPTRSDKDRNPSLKNLPTGLGHQFFIVTADKKAWNNEKGQKIIVAQIKEALRHEGEMLTDGFGKEYYDVYDQNHEDAMSCWAAHARTQSCDDFRTPKMKLMPDTAELRREVGANEYQSNTYLCQFCPVFSIVEQHARKAKGMYN